MRNQSITQDSKTPQTVDTGRGVSLLYNNRYLYSKFNPQKRADAVANGTPITPMTIYLIPSPLLFYGVDKLIKRIDPHSTILTFELSKELYQITEDSFKEFLQQNSEASKLQIEGRLIYKSGSLKEVFSLIEERKLVHNARRVSTVPFSGGYDLLKSDYDIIADRIAMEIALIWKNRSTLNQLSELWYRNIFRNSSKLADSTPISHLNPKGLKCAVIGAGESLEKSFNHLREKRSELYIIVADTALPSLIEAKIVPDCIIALEAQHYNLTDFLTDKKELEKIHLIAELSSSPSVIDKFRSYTLFYTQFSSATLFQRIAIEFPQLFKSPQLGSVGVAALFFGLMLSREKIYSAGLDFSYKRGKSHCKGTFYNTRLLANSIRLNPQSNSYAINRKERYLFDEKRVTTAVLESYLKSSCELTQNFNQKIKGESLMNRVIPSEKNREKREWKFPTDTKKIESERIKKFLLNESEELTKLIKKRDGIEELIGKNGKLNYLSDTVKIKSTQEAGNKIAAMIKLRATRYNKIIENQISNIRLKK